jgi:hypothetical protein
MITKDILYLSMSIRTDFSLYRSLCTIFGYRKECKRKKNIIEREQRNLYIDCRKTRGK